MTATKSESLSFHADKNFTSDISNWDTLMKRVLNKYLDNVKGTERNSEAPKG